MLEKFVLFFGGALGVGILNFVFKLFVFKHKVNQVEFESTKAGYEFYTAELMKMSVAMRDANDREIKHMKEIAELLGKVTTLTLENSELNKEIAKRNGINSSK